MQPQLPGRPTGKTVAVVAAAQQLTRAGHTVAVFERDDRIGGLLRYGIPDFKMEKKQIEARPAQMTAEGTRFRPGINIGVDITGDSLRSRYDAVVVATGVMVPRDLPIPGADCIRTAHRQLAVSVTNLAIGQQPGPVAHRLGNCRRSRRSSRWFPRR